MTVPVVRQRAKAPKTRTGCKTCRQRHIKCDEIKPACDRCTRTGRHCAGYDTTKKHSNDVRKLPFVQPKHMSPGLALSPESLQQMTTTERNAFDYFRMQTVHQLPGNAWLLSWERLSITASLTEPAILHAIIALGSLHQAYGIFSPSPYIEGSSVDHNLHDFAIDQCNQAMVLASSHIGNLTSHSSDAEVQVVMLMSLLMFCFEVWCGQDLRASLHLRTGLRILYDRVKLPTESASRKLSLEKRSVEVKVNPQSDMDVLLQTSVRLDMDLTIQGRTDPYLYPIVRDDIPSVFLSLQDAMVYLDALAANIQDVSRQVLDRAIGALQDDGVGNLDDNMLSILASVNAKTVDLSSNIELATRVDQSKRDVSRWMSAFAFIPFTSDRQSAHLLAQIQAFCLWHEVSFWREPNEMLQDRFEEQFSYILGLCERYVELHRNGSPPNTPSSDSDSQGPTRPAFSLGTGLVPCIFIIAFKCRKSTIRRRAVQLVRSINLTGVFDAYCVASFCQTIIDIEESYARQDLPGKDEFQSHEIPREARLLEVNMTDWSKSEFYKSNECRMVYAKLGEKGEAVVRLQDFAIIREMGGMQIDPRLLSPHG